MVPTFDRETRQVTPIIEEMFLGVARRLRPRLATFTGLDTPVAVKGVRPVALSQFLEGDTWADASVWATYGQEDGDELVVVALDGRLVARMMGPLMGQGAADEVADDEVLRPITPVELRVGTRLTRFLVDAFESSWSVGVPPRLRHLASLLRSHAAESATSRVSASSASPGVCLLRRRIRRSYPPCAAELLLGSQAPSPTPSA